MVTGRIISGSHPASFLMRQVCLIVIEFLTGLSLFSQIRYGFEAGSSIVTLTPP